MWRRARKDHLAQCTCAGPDVEPIFVWRHTEPRHELAGNQAAPSAYIWLIGITASPYILTFSSHRVSQTTFFPKDTECLPGRIWSACPRDVRFALKSRNWLSALGCLFGATSRHAPRSPHLHLRGNDSA